MLCTRLQSGRTHSLAPALLGADLAPLELDNLADPVAAGLDARREGERVAREALGEGVDRRGFFLSGFGVDRRTEREGPQETGEDDEEGALRK